jgi:putative hydrolase of the HAD superfamily
MSRVFLFDIGNVLVHFDFRTAIRRLVEASGANPDEVESVLAPIKDDLESGRLSDDDFIKQGISRIGFGGSRAEFTEIWSDIFTENVPMIALVEKLAGRHLLYLFSNTSGLHKEWLFGKFPVFARFDGGVYSYKAGCTKPHEPIYREAITRFGLDPAETIYIDDLPENIAAGERLGFATHHYAAARHAALEERVERWLIYG